MDGGRDDIDVLHGRALALLRADVEAAHSESGFFWLFGLVCEVFGEPAAASNSSRSCASSSPVDGAGGGSTTGSSSTGGSTGAGGGAGVSSTASARGGIASPQNSHVPRFVGRFSNMQTGHSHFSPSSAMVVVRRPRTRLPLV